MRDRSFLQDSKRSQHNALHELNIDLAQQDLYFLSMQPSQSPLPQVIGKSGFVYVRPTT